uniref:THUMP domain-containing protein n=1 Tax=Astatotilapia calliptera TaxID=8154 RepID=A0A3P8RA11_ASTCA
MDEPGSGGNVVRYYCTAGNGMEAFLINEVKTKLAAEDVCQIPGKVLFSSSAKINRVSNLKGAERLFLLLKQDSPVSLSCNPWDPHRNRHSYSVDMFKKMFYFCVKQEVSRVIGAGLSRLLGWKADLKNPQLEINVHLSDDYCLLGIPLTRLPLANRSYIKITGLRSTTAWAMASLAHIQPGFRVVDPMCGVGTILIEAAQEHKDACFLGVDIDEAQLQKASENIAFAELENRINLLKASSLVLPVPSATVDAVICDLPFGRKFGSRIDMAANLPLILTEMERVLRPGGILVLLLSPQLSCLLKKLLIEYDTGPTSNPETKPQTGMQNCPSSSRSPSKKQTFQIHSGVKSSPSQETKLQHSLPFTVSSLKHQATFRVSLGAIDGLIHKYVKTDCCVFRDVMF